MIACDQDIVESVPNICWSVRTFLELINVVELIALTAEEYVHDGENFPVYLPPCEFVLDLHKMNKLHWAETFVNHMHLSSILLTS